MKTYLNLLFLLLTCTLFGQVDRTRYTLVYSLHLSDAAGKGPGKHFDPGLGQSVFAIAELSTKRSSLFTIGAGFLQSVIKHSDLHYPTFDSIVEYFTMDFVTIPAGVKFSFGSFFIHPEVAANFNYRNTIQSYFLDSEMKPLDEPYARDIRHHHIEVHFTSLMSLGYELKVGSMSFLTGVKGYFAFTDNFVNTFGAGLMVGLKM